jgi:hypothetical protein
MSLENPDGKKDNHIPIFHPVDDLHQFCTSAIARRHTSPTGKCAKA